MLVRRVLYGAGASILVAAGLVTASLAFAQEPDPAATVSAAQAQEAALAAMPGTVIDLELENEDGVNLYEVEIRPEAGGSIVEVAVDATTGAVIGTEVEDEDEGPFDDLDELFGSDDR